VVPGSDSAQEKSDDGGKERAGNNTTEKEGSAVDLSIATAEKVDGGDGGAAPRNAPSGVRRAERAGDIERNGVAMRARMAPTEAPLDTPST